VQEGLLDTNPVAGTGKADEGGSRERLLTPEELRKLWRALGDDPFSDVVRLLLLTGQRRNEIGKLTWAEVDLARKMIVLAPERTKNSHPHCIQQTDHSDRWAEFVGLARQARIPI